MCTPPEHVSSVVNRVTEIVRFMPKGENNKCNKANVPTLVSYIYFT